MQTIDTGHTITYLKYGADFVKLSLSADALQLLKQY